MCEATRVLPCLISHPRLLLPLLLHGAQVAMAVVVQEEAVFMSFDFVQFKKDRQLKPWKYVRAACMRPCCLMPAGNEHLRPKEHSAFPFTVMCFSRVNTLSLFACFCAESNLMKLFLAEADQRNFKQQSAAKTFLPKGNRAMPRGAVAASCMHTRACGQFESSPMC